MATRPCLISASRHFLMSPGAAPSDRPRGSKIWFFVSRQAEERTNVGEQKNRYLREKQRALHLKRSSYRGEGEGVQRLVQCMQALHGTCGGRTGRAYTLHTCTYHHA